MLHCLGLELPKRIFGHPWLLFDNDKMSKSKGNIVYADDLVKEYGVDAIRFYLLHEIPSASDGSFNNDLLIESINTNLANTLGNLVNRTIGMINKYFDGVVSKKDGDSDLDKDFISYVVGIKDIVDNKMEEIRVADSLDSIFDLYRRCNKYIDETEPWVLAKDVSKLDRLSTVLYNLVEAIRFGTVLLQAFLPDTANKIFEQLNTNYRDYSTLDKFGYYEDGNKVLKGSVLFKRIEK